MYERIWGCVFRHSIFCLIFLFHSILLPHPSCALFNCYAPFFHAYFILQYAQNCSRWSSHIAQYFFILINCALALLQSHNKRENRLHKCCVCVRAFCPFPLLLMHLNLGFRNTGLHLFRSIARNWCVLLQWIETVTIATDTTVTLTHFLYSHSFAHTYSFGLCVGICFRFCFCSVINIKNKS